MAFIHRVQVQASIMFDITTETKLTDEQISRLASNTLLGDVDDEEGYDLKSLDGGRVYPKWTGAEIVNVSEKEAK